MFRHKGFTLLEALVVLSIMAIVISLISLSMSHILVTQREAKIDADMTLILVAMQMYENEFGDQASSIEDLVKGNCLKVVPKSPLQGYEYHIEKKGDENVVALKKGGTIYHQGDYYGEKST